MSRHGAVRERVRRDWGLELPDGLFALDEVVRGLGPEARRAFREDLWASPAGVADLFDDPARAPRDGIDVTVHGRFYRDPPEFVTFLYAGSDGLHYGLWFDDGRTCDGVASYWTRDGGLVERRVESPLAAVRALVERVQRDLEDDPGEPETAGRLDRLARLREAITAVETGDRPETGAAYSRRYDRGGGRVDPDRVHTLDGAGALAAGGQTALGRPPLGATDEEAFARHMDGVLGDPRELAAAVAEARRRLLAGDPAEALALGRDLYWTSAGDPVREAHAAALLPAAYRALGRPALAAIATAHHTHRGLRSVDVLG